LRIILFRNNKNEQFCVDCIVGFNNDSHDNVVWNYLQSYIAYSVENIVVIEQLSKERRQKLITLPEQISVLQLSRDFQYLLVGAAVAND